MSAAAKQLHARPAPPRTTIFMRPCPVTGKRGYESKVDAVTVASRAARSKPQRAYQCEFCHRWHLTSQPRRTAAA